MLRSTIWGARHFDPIAPATEHGAAIVHDIFKITSESHREMYEVPSLKIWKPKSNYLYVKKYRFKLRHIMC